MNFSVKITMLGRTNKEINCRNTTHNLLSRNFFQNPWKTPFWSQQEVSLSSGCLHNKIICSASHVYVWIFLLRNWWLGWLKGVILPFSENIPWNDMSKLLFCLLIFCCYLSDLNRYQNLRTINSIKTSQKVH